MSAFYLKHIYNMTSEAPSGQAMIWNSDEKIILSRRLYALRVNKNLVDNNYLKYFRRCC